jgi:hypothetical protein
MATEDGNVQDIAVADKEHPSLGATKEAQNVTVLNKIIVPPASYTNPNDPMAASGSINLDLDQHPMEISPDYGQSTLDAHSGERDVVTGVQDENSADMSDALNASDPNAVSAGGAGTPGAREKAVATPAHEYPEDKDTWLKGDWQAKAREYGLAVSGNLDTISGRVKEYEEGVEEAKQWNATQWKTAVDDAETADDVAELRALYGRSGAEFVSVVEAFDAKDAELANPEK